MFVWYHLVSNHVSGVRCNTLILQEHLSSPALPLDSTSAAQHSRRNAGGMVITRWSTRRSAAKATVAAQIAQVQRLNVCGPACDVRV